MRLARWLIARFLPEDWRESIAGDLEEERDHRRADGRQSGAVWAAFAALVTIARLRREDRRGLHASSGRGLQARMWVQEFRLAVRTLAAAPRFTAVALLILALGIGATTAIYSVVDAVVLRPMPFPDPDRLVAVGEMNAATAVPYVGSTAAPNYEEWLAQQHVFQQIGATVTSRDLVMRDGGPPESFTTVQSTASIFDVLGIRPQLGAAFTPENEQPGRHRVAMLSDGLWRRRFAADPLVIGKTMRFDTGVYEIVGVLPAGLAYPSSVLRPVDLWVPFARIELNDRSRTGGRNYNMRVVARLNDGVTIDQARAEMAAITARLAAQYPKWFEGMVSVVWPLHDATTGRVRPWMLMMLAAVGFVLLIACVNVANIMLARTTTRARELAVRAALGASRWQVARSLLIESLVLSFAGAICGLLVASWGVSLLRASLPATLPRIAEIGIDLRVLTAAAAAAVLTGVVCGLAPALKFSRPRLSNVLVDGGRSSTAGRDSQRLRASFVVVEVALAVVLLVGAGLFISSFARLVTIDLGFDYRGVTAIGVNPRLDMTDPKAFEKASARTAPMVSDVLARARAIPGVEVAAFLSGGSPLSGSWYRNVITVPGKPAFERDQDQVDIRHVTPDYALVVRAELRSGRYLQSEDTAGTPLVAVLNEESVRRFFDGRSPLGVTVQLDDAPRVVVGIVANSRVGGPETPMRPEAYLPFAQGKPIGGTLIVRASGNTERLAPALKAAVQAVLPDVVVPEPKTLEQSLASLVALRKFNTLLLAVFGLLAVMIAAAGIYGVMAYVVAQRTKEIGLRMALGAQAASVLRLVLGRALLYITLGGAIGLVAAWWLSNSIRTFLFDARPHDPFVYVGAAVVLAASGLMAALMPALRASRVDPMVALRAE